jgi:hypothetical protein
MLSFTIGTAALAIPGFKPLGVVRPVSAQAKPWLNTRGIASAKVGGMPFSGVDYPKSRCDARLQRRNSDTLSESGECNTTSSGTSHHHFEIGILQHGNAALKVDPRGEIRARQLLATSFFRRSTLEQRYGKSSGFDKFWVYPFDDELPFEFKPGASRALDVHAQEDKRVTLVLSST